MANRNDVEFVVRVKDAATAALNQVSGAFSSTIGKITNFKGAIGSATTAIGSLTLGVLAKDIFDLGVAWDKTFRQIAASLPTATEGIAGLKASVRDVALTFGKSLEDVAQAAAQIAHLGVANAQEVSDRLRTATKISVATGTELQAVVAGMDQVMDAFGLTADQAAEKFANLVSAAKGRVDIEAMLQAFQAVAPVLHDLGVDADTATKALVALLDSGRSVKQIRGIIADADVRTIKELASTADIASESMKQLDDAVGIVTDSTEVKLERYKTAWKEAMTSVFASIKEGSVNILDWLSRAKNALDNLVPEQGRKNLAAFLDNSAKAQGAPDTTGADDIGGEGGNLEAGRQEAEDAAAVARILAAAEARKQAAKTAGDLAKQLDSVAQKESFGGSEAAEFAAKIAQWQTQAVAGGASIESLSKQLAKYNTALAILRSKENADALKQQADAAKDAASAWAALDDVVTELSNSAIAQFDHSVSRTLDGLREKQAKITNPDEWQAVEDAINAVTARYADLRTAVVETDETQKQLAADLANLSGDSIQSFMDDWSAKAADVETRMKAATDPAKAAQLRKEWEAIKSVLDQVSAGLPNVTPPVVDARKHVLELAQSWDQIGRSVIAAAQAVGGLDDTTAAALQNMVTLGHGIIDLFGSNIGAGIAEIVSSLGALMHGSSALAKRVEEDWKGVLATIAGLASPLSQARTGNDLTAREADLRQQFSDARAGVEANFAGKMLEGPREQFLKQLNDVEAQRLELLKQQYDLEQRQLQEDYHIRLLRAEGFTTEADAEALAIEQQREMADAIANGADKTTQAALAAAQYAEAQKAAADATHAAAKAAVDKANQDADQEIRINNITDPLAQFKVRAKAAVKTGGSFGAIFSGYDLDNLTPEQVDEIHGKIRDFFATLKNSPDAIDTAGLSIDDLIDECLAFGDAAQAVADAVQAATDSFNDAMSNLSLVERVFGTTPEKHAQDVASYAGIDLSQFDLATQAGHDAALKVVQDMATEHPEMMSIWAGVADAINAVPVIDATGAGSASIGGSANGSASAAGYQSLTTVQGDRLLDISLREMNAVLDIRDDVHLLATRLTAAALPIQPIGSFTSSPNSAGAARAGAGIAIGPVNIHVTSSSDDAATQGREMARSFAREIDIEFGRSATLRKVMRGDISIAGGG